MTLRPSSPLQALATCFHCDRADDDLGDACTLARAAACADEIFGRVARARGAEAARALRGADAPGQVCDPGGALAGSGPSHREQYARYTS